MKRPMFLVPFFLAAVLGGSVSAAPPLPQGTIEKTLSHGNLPRTYLVHIPPGYDGTKAVPLVLAFHGRGDTAAKAALKMGFDPVADQYNFIVAYPQGMNEHWNDGRPAPAFPNAELIDDVGFVSRLITDCLLVEFQIDPTRVYATGFSNGGFFAHRVGWELSDKLAAIAPVAGTMDVNRAANFYPRGPVSVLDIHGTLDEIVKYEGGLVGTTGAKAISAPEVVAMWAKADGCNPVPVVEFNPDNFPGDRARTRHEIYTGGLAGTEVVLVTMEGLEHNWPQARTANLRPGQEGSRQNAAAMLIWNFFERHPKK